LVVEDDEGIQKQLKWCFDDMDVLIAGDRATAIAHLRRHEPSVVLQDLGLPPDPEGVSEGFETVKEILELAPQTKVIVVTGNQDKDNAVRAVGMGAYDFYQKPLDTDTLRLIVDRAYRIHDLEEENRELNRVRTSSPIEGIIATSEPMMKVCRMIEKVAPADVTVLVLGESGTGKELLARAVHTLSPRKDGKFVAINCAAIPENLLESELYGYERGAFTGAVKTTPGKIELASGGTLFLDEIGDMPLPLQAKLLRFLQERVIERIGGRTEIPVDVRVVCATNQDLQALISRQQFREDLYYRVSEITVQVPPLRERQGGISVLATVFLNKFAAVNRKRLAFSKEALDAIESYGWPGNVRELENRVKTAAIMAEGNQVSAEDLGLKQAEGGTGLLLNLKEVRNQAELQAIRQAVAVAEGNISRAAELLGITRPTLYSLMEKHGVQG
jgi:two-component system NtrC family response regulator